MRKATAVSVAVAVCAGLGISISVAAPKSKVSVPNQTTNTKIVTKPDLSTAVLNPISDVKVSCCGGSMSSARVCVSATLKNNGDAPVTYSTKFIGQKAGECIKQDDEYCKKNTPPPGGLGLCVPPCLQTAPPTPVTANGSAVTVPAKGTAPVNITAPNNTYGQGSKLEVQITGKTPISAPVPPITQCVL